MKTVHTLGVLATLVSILAAGPAFAAKPELRSQTVSYADIDVNTDDGARTMMKRINRAARRVCMGQRQNVAAMTAEFKCRDTATAQAVATLGSPTVLALHSGGSRPIQLAQR